ARRVAIARGSGAILPTAVLGADGDSVWFREGVAQLGRVTADGRHATWPVPVAGRPVAAEPDGGVDWLTFQPDEQLLRIGAGGDVLSRAAVVPRPVPRPAPPAPGHGLAWSLCLPPLSQLCQLDPERATINTLQVAQAGAYLTETPVSGPGGALWTEDSKGHLLRVGADGQTRSYPLHPRHGNAIELLAASGKALWMLEVNQHNRPRALTRVTT
ncbi:MAG TPA: hypothetical protein VI318_16615, partial [Baekduia sp.]